jgi:hypothetical protein
MKKQKTPKKDSQHPTPKSTSTKKRIQQDAIICPHCKQETSVSAFYREEVVNTYKDPVTFEKGEWKIDYGYVKLVNDESQCQAPHKFTCAECHEESDEDSLNELWKASHEKPKKRGQIDPLKKRKLEL